jgi:hypothetical protein
MWYLWGALIGLALALVFVLVFYKFYYPGLAQQATLAAIDPVQLQNSNIELLEQEIRTYRAALEGDVCLAPPLPDSAPLFRARPAAPAVPGGAAPGPPPANAPPPINPAAGDNGEAATVMVLAKGDDAGSIGTGFFINDHQILTNRHVVEVAAGADGLMAVTSQTLGKVVRVDVKATSKPNEGLRDYAVLELTQPVPHGRLRFQTRAQRMDRVGTWGYPALNTEMDPQMQALIDGDFSSAPEVIYTEGVISVVQRGKGIPPFINHTAEVSQGNSGGPLVNAEGDVVGINTKIRTDEESNRQVNLSISSEDIVKFLQENGISYELAPQGAV